MRMRSCRASPNKPSPQPPPPSTRPEPDHPARSRAAREVLGLGVPTSTVTTHATCSEAWLSSRVPSAQMRRCARLLCAQAEKTRDCNYSRVRAQARRHVERLGPRASNRPKFFRLVTGLESLVRTTFVYKKISGLRPTRFEQKSSEFLLWSQASATVSGGRGSDGCASRSQPVRTTRNTSV